VNVYYADTSAIVRAYFADEVDHSVLKATLIDGGNAVVTSEIARVEFASAVGAASRAGRIRRPEVFLTRFDADCGPSGAIALLRLDPSLVLGSARDLVRAYGVRTLDALHLAVVLTEAVSLARGGVVTLVTRDAGQAAAAHALGLATL
jgi:predicted nucleic acid-binding protein